MDLTMKGGDNLYIRLPNGLFFFVTTDGKEFTIVSDKFKQKYRMNEDTDGLERISMGGKPMDRNMAEALDRHITGNYGEDQYKQDHKNEVDQAWSKFEWPEWVPQEVREQIMGFWANEYGGRGVKGYEANCLTQAPYKMGQNVNMKNFAGKMVKGQFIHCWNNIGRVITKEGKIEYVDYCGTKKQGE